MQQTPSEKSNADGSSPPILANQNRCVLNADWRKEARKKKCFSALRIKSNELKREEKQYYSCKMSQSHIKINF